MTLIEKLLPVVADSWPRLRGCDVFRLLDAIQYDASMDLDAAAGVILRHRPDLKAYTHEAVSDIAEERGMLSGVTT